MTELEKKLFEMLDDILDGIIFPEDLVRITGLPLEKCEEILNTYYAIKEGWLRG